MNVFTQAKERSAGEVEHGKMKYREQTHKARIRWGNEVLNGRRQKHWENRCLA